ncbi:MAG: Gfo/Idh/MocA family oxidoreductase [Lachnospiraceae bacterium]|nr:Gfo/Idh/MocA family oxidoreductase [Lachnospiraceae bacterium]
MSVKWGVLGTAGIARGCTIPGMKEAENCELYAIAGRDEAKVENYKEEFGFEKAYVGYDSLLADPDIQAVYIPLSNNLHKEWVLKAVRAGKHVLCEKPLALTADDQREMFAAARENNVLLMEAFAYLHSPYVSMLRDEITSGSIGEVDYIETSFLTQGYIDDIRIHRETGGGAIYDLGCYCTTMILSLVDSKPDLVLPNAEFNDNGVDTFSSALIRFENGIRAAFTVGMVFSPKQLDRWDSVYIHGSRGRIVSNIEYNQCGKLHFTVLSDGKTIEKTFEARQNYALEIEQFGRCIEDKEKPHVSEEFSIKNAELLDMILEKTDYYKAGI